MQANSCQRWQAPRLENTESHESDIVRPYSTQDTVEQREHMQKLAYDAGFAQGVRDGMKAGQERVREQAEYMQAIMQQMSEPLRELDVRVVNELVELSMAAVRQMVRRELKISPGEIVGVVREALSTLPVASNDVRLELHPKDAAIVREALGGEEQERSWHIVEEPMLSRGGCRVITATSQIDATVENRLNAVIASVMGGERFVD